MGVFSPKWAFFLKEKVFAFYARPLDVDPSLLLMLGPWPLMEVQQKKI